MDNEFELKVEKYDAKSAEAKRKKIMARVAIGVGSVALLGVLAYFGLSSMRGAEQETRPRDNQGQINHGRDHRNNQGGLRRWFNSRTNRDWNGPHVVGGSGSWYASVVVHLEE